MEIPDDKHFKCCHSQTRYAPDLFHFVPDHVHFVPTGSHLVYIPTTALYIFTQGIFRDHDVYTASAPTWLAFF
jgi:hypothetical protein